MCATKCCVRSVLESLVTKLSEREIGKFVFLMQIDILCFGAIASELKEEFVNSLMLKLSTSHKDWKMFSLSHIYWNFSLLH